jgi:hypothetical protein
MRRAPDPSDPAEGSLPVEDLPDDRPGPPYAAADQAPREPDLDTAAHDPDAPRNPRLVMQAYANALGGGDASAAAAVYAQNAAVFTEDGQVNGREEILRWHERLLGAGAVHAEPVGQGNDAGRLNVHGPGGDRVVELAFDASGRIGSARWLRPESAAASQEDRIRRAW